MDIDNLERSLRDRPVLTSLPRLGRCSILFDVAGTRFLVSTGAQIAVRTDPGINDAWDFSFTVPADAWERFTAPVPPPRHNTAQALVAELGPEIVDGDRRRWAQYAPVVEQVLQSLRDAPAEREAPRLPGESQIVGRYVHVAIQDVEYRVYYESAGQGIPLICLHTAGSDSRQFRFLLEDREITARFRLLAFDLPWHGRSSPPADWRSTTYELSADWYAQAILAFVQAMHVERPVLMGCSMGGAIALYMASVHGAEFRAVCSLEGGLGNPSRRVEWTRHAEVDHALFLSTWVDGLMSPNSPRALRDEVLWQYAQSAPGVYNGDTAFAGTELRGPAGELEPATCPLYVFSGEYDYSSTPEMSRTAAEALGGRFILMEGMGHFPMAEDPERFREHLVPVLDEIATGGQ